MSDTRTRILAEATRQLITVGYPAFTVAAVRDALGLSSGSMFHAFPSKAALAAAVYVDGMTSYQRAATTAIAAKSDPEKAVFAWVIAHCTWIEDHPALARFLFATLPDEVMAESAAPLAERNAAFYATLSALFERAESAGLMGRIERPLAQALCIGPAHDYGRKWTSGQAKTPPRKLSHKLARAALAALASTAPPRARARMTQESR